MPEEMLDQFNKKVLLTGEFSYDFDTNDAMLDLYVDYDDGTGFKYPREGSNLLFFAEQIRKNMNFEYDDFFELDKYSRYYYKTKAKGLVNDSNNFKLFVRQLYGFGMELNVPLFLNIEDDYFFVNEMKFTDYDKRNEVFLTQKKYEDIKNFISDHVYGENYEELKKEDTFQKILSKSSSSKIG